MIRDYEESRKLWQLIKQNFQSVSLRSKIFTICLNGGNCVNLINNVAFSNPLLTKAKLEEIQELADSMQQNAPSLSVNESR